MARLLWTQKQTIGPGPRILHAMAYDRRRAQVILFGGDVSGTVVANDTWAWNGQDWTQLTDMGPMPRHRSALAYDRLRERVVLFGGIGFPEAGSLSNRVTMNDTWEWDGEFWTQVAETGPPARFGHAMAYDDLHKRVVLFGGQAEAANLLGDTWSWDGTEWTQVSESGPSNRYAHAMAYDEVRARIVLQGGKEPSQLHPPLEQEARTNDTWEWSGVNWTHRTNLGPGFLADHAMVYNGKRVVLFGGIGGARIGASAPLGHTFEWDGSHWTQHQDMGPGSRFGHAMAHDSARNRVVLQGGSPGLQADTWESFESAPDGHS